MKSSRFWDAIIIGGGIIGLALARELRKHSFGVLVIERGEPGREASHAAAGMLAPHGGDLQPELEELAHAGAALYPEFVQEVEDESGMKVDLRREGSIVFTRQEEKIRLPPGSRMLTAGDLDKLEPRLVFSAEACFIPDQSVDPRVLLAGLVAAAKHIGVDFVSGAAATEILAGDQVITVNTRKSHYVAPVVVNCCGAWAGEIKSEGSVVKIPARPVKGQMLSVVAPHKDFLRHVIRHPDIYLVPRSDGRILIGATVEEAGFDKRVVPATIQHMQQCAANLMPELGGARILEAWAGLRPSTPDDLPILSATQVPGYFAATGHFRNGILLAPVTAVAMTQLVRSTQPEFDLSAFSVARYSK